MYDECFKPSIQKRTPSLNSIYHWRSINLIQDV